MYQKTHLGVTVTEDCERECALGTRGAHVIGEGMNQAGRVQCSVRGKSF